jgi:hypothetical protein
MRVDHRAWGPFTFSPNTIVAFDAGDAGLHAAGAGRCGDDALLGDGDLLAGAVFGLSTEALLGDRSALGRGGENN